MDSSTDFEELSARVRTQSEDAAGSDTERVTVRSLEEVSCHFFGGHCDENCVDCWPLIFWISDDEEIEHDANGNTDCDDGSSVDEQ